MKKIKVETGGDRTVRIRVQRKKEHEVLESSRMELSSISAKKADKISIPSSIIAQMELRVESIFRPNEQDVEVVYALSGVEKMVDQLHNFSSRKIVAHATPEMISYFTENMVEYIQKERPDIPRIIVHLHTHPSGISILSDADIKTMPEVAKSIRKSIPNASVFFGVHAVSGESRQLRTSVERISENSIRWSSITRLHEVAFFDENARPIGVGISHNV